jgi:hypothetical protein
MDGSPIPHLKRSASDPIAKLERGGGAVWARRPGQEPLFTLSYAPRHGADVVIVGTMDRIFALPLADLRLIGWKPDASGFIRQTWILRSDLDRSELRRTVEQTIALLAPMNGAEPSAYRLDYRPPGQEDPGDTEIGCLLAIPSILIGDLIGGLMTVARGEALPLIEAAIFAAVVGASLGYLALGTLVPRVLALVPATRTAAAETVMSLQLLIQGLVAAATWLLLPVIGLRDGDQLLLISAGIGVAVFVVLPVLTALRNQEFRDRFRRKH